MNSTIRNHEFRLYPTTKQEVVLVSWLGLHCELYNSALEERRSAWIKNRKSISYLDQQNQLPLIKFDRSELIPLGSHALQNTLRRVDLAFAGFFRRVKSKKDKAGFPRFRSRDRFDSFCYPDKAGWKVLSHTDRSLRLKISNLGTFTVRGSTRISLDSCEFRTLTVKRKADKWYVIVSCKYQKEDLQRNVLKQRSSVGIDVGVSTFAYLSDTTKIENPRHLNKSLKQLKDLQQNLSSKKLRSNNRKKAKAKLAKVYQKVTNQRKDFLHKTSSALVSKYDFIAVEDLDLKQMTKRRSDTDKVPNKTGLNRSMLDAGLGLFFQMLQYKAEEAGTEFVKIDPKNTTQECSNCGSIVSKDLSDRIHKCLCGLEIDRDYNASINILKRGFKETGREPSKVPIRYETTSMRQHGAW